MQADFWHQRWQDNQIGFHLPSPHPLLSQWMEKKPLPLGHVVFVPLCGKTLDIGYLLSQGLQVVAIELSEVAVVQLFKAMKITPVMTDHGELKCYSTEQLKVYVGDVFKLSADLLGPVNWVYDRAALVALPIEMRQQYALHLQQITDHAPQLLISIEYNQDEMDGPPFSVDSTAVNNYYQAYYDCELLSEQAIEGGLKGKVAAVEKLWRLDQR